MHSLINTYMYIIYKSISNKLPNIGTGVGWGGGVRNAEIQQFLVSFLFTHLLSTNRTF